MINSANRLAYTADLDKPVRKTYLDTLFATMDRNAHRFEITVLRGGAAADLSGYTVKGCFVRLKDNAQRSIKGSIVDGKVICELDEACYLQAGVFTMSIKVIKDDEKTTVFYGEGSMSLSETENAITDEYEVINLENELNEFKDEISTEFGAALQQVTVLGSNAAYSVGATVTFNDEFVNCYAYYGRLKGNSSALFYSVGSSGAINMVSYAFPSTTQTAIRIVRLEKTASDTEKTRTVQIIKQVLFSSSGAALSDLESIEIGPIWGFRTLNVESKGEMEV